MAALIRVLRSKTLLRGSSAAEHRPHNPEGAGSSPAPAPNILRWEARIGIEADKKGIIILPEDGNKEAIRDYLNVTVKGYLSTFEGTTKADRDGDYVVQGAFAETLPKFLERNPVMLRDHVNATEHVVGSFSKAVEDDRGLYVEAMLSNAPDIRNIRFKVAEGHLRTLSMGGIFHRSEDGRGIFKVDLWEGSIVAIPANPDATFSVRGLNDSEQKFLSLPPGTFKTYRDFLSASKSQNLTGLAA